MRKYRVNILGLGYIGTVTALHLARTGHAVTATDIDPDRVRLLQRGELPFADDDLIGLHADLLKRKIDLSYVENEPQNLPQAPFWVICVNTPFLDQHGPELRFLFAALDFISSHAKDTRKPLVIIRSTLPPGTFTRIESKYPELPLALYPEFMREGNALADINDPPLSILGVRPGFNLTSEVEQLFGLASPLRTVTPESAETIKVASNAFHGLKIGFANEIASLARAVGADPFEVMREFCADKKLNISPAYLRPGFAFGGPCLEKDIDALKYVAKENRIYVPVLNNILFSNDSHLLRFTDFFLKHKAGPRTLILGMNFKVGTKDHRNSPMRRLIDLLKSEDASLDFVEMQNFSDSSVFRALNQSSFDQVVLGTMSASPELMDTLSRYTGLLFDTHQNKEFHARLSDKPGYFSFLSPKSGEAQMANVLQS